MALTESSLKQFMADSLGVDTAAITADTLLFTDGIIDSFALVTLLSHIEESCGFRVRPDEVTLDNFDSIARMLAYAGRRLAGG
jgi:acyl carrier protein